MMGDVDYLRAAYIKAQKSRDPSTQNGAILVGGWIVASGYNGFPIGIKETPKRWRKPLKYQFVEHAERDAICDAAWCGVSTQGLTMYCPWSACVECARAIIQAGIVEVVSHHLPQHSTRADWRDSIRLGSKMLKEAGVEVRRIKCKIGLQIRFNGELIEV